MPTLAMIASRMHHSRVLVVSLCLLVAAAAETSAQQKVVMPDAEKIVLLVRNTLVTLNNAVQTGNFTVLRDIGAPSFREANTAARLSRSFADLAARNIDLSVVTVITPQLTEKPSLDPEKGMLRLKGYFPSKTAQIINFELLYQAVDGRWRLFGLSVQPSGSKAPPETSSGAGATSVKKKK